MWKTRNSKKVNSKSLIRHTIWLEITNSASRWPYTLNRYPGYVSIFMCLVSS